MPVTVAVEEWESQVGAWTVEAVSDDGEIYQAIFIGPEAEERAYEYARFKYDFSRRPPPR